MRPPGMNAFLPKADRPAPLAAVLRRLDLVLAEAVERTAAVTGSLPTDPLYPYVGPRGERADVIGATPSTILHVPEAAERLAEGDLLELGQRFGLDSVDQALVVLAVAPELEVRYQRIYGYLHDDATRRRPTIDLALRLLCGDLESRLSHALRLDLDGPVRRFGLVEVIPSDSLQAAGLALEVAPDPGFVRWLLGAADFDPRLDEPVVVPPVVPGLDPQVEGELLEIWLRTCGGARTPRLAIHGSTRELRRRVAAMLAAEIKRPLVSIQLDSSRSDRRVQAAIARRETLVRDAVLHVEGDLAALHGLPAPGIAGSTGPGEIDAPSFALETTPAVRRAAWMHVLADPELAQAAGDRYPLELESIESAARLARTTAAGAGAGRKITLADVAAAVHARAQTALTRLASPAKTTVGWADLVLPEHVVAQLRELGAQVVNRTTLRDVWGFDARRGLLGVTALFAGPSGTGKSLAAEVVAAELLLPLWRVDLSQVVSKYIGETEQNLSEVFAAAESSGVMLLFDEADALFGKRSEVTDSHDRYANLEISYLLQRMEVYDGIAVLSTNLLHHLDDAFARRLSSTIHFPFPDADLRRLLWRSIWPKRAPLDDDVDLDGLAEEYELTGGNIQNIAVTAANLAASDGRVIRRQHLDEAIDREYRKLGRSPLVTEEELAT